MNLKRQSSVLWLAALALLAAVVLLHEILLPFVAGAVLAYLLHPLVDRLERAGINRALAAVAIVGTFLAGVATVLLYAVPLIGMELAVLIEKFPGYIGQLQALAADPQRPWLRKIAGLGLSEAEQSAGELASLAADWIPAFLRSLWTDSQALISIFSLLIVTPIITIYLLNDWNSLISSIEKAIPPSHREAVAGLAKEIDSMIAGFFRGQGTICLILALYYAAALRLTGLNHGILIGLIAGLISFIPYLGSFTGLALSLAVAVLQFWPSWTMIPVIAGIFAAGQAIADYVLAPYFVASRIELNPLWVMFAVAAFGYLFGFVGLLIAVPLAAAMGAVIRFAIKEYSLSPAQPGEAPAAPAPPAELSPPRKSWFKAFFED